MAKVQCEALAELGHEVTLFAGWDGYAELRVPGVEVRLFKVRKALPVSGFSALRAHGLSKALADPGRSFDMVHVHLARDLVTLPAARALARQHRPFVVQTHGMVSPDGRPRARLFDALLTRPVLRAASAHLVLTESEQRAAKQISRAPIGLVRIGNGVRRSELRAEWSVELAEVIYCARLHERKRPAEFVRMAAELVRRGVDARFTIAGPDDMAKPVIQGKCRGLGLGAAVTYIGALEPDAVLPRLSRAQVYVLPSVDEPFPMSLLEAMSVGLPSVLTASTGISNDLRQSGAASVTDGSAIMMADAVEHLLSGPSVWARASARALSEVRASYSANAVGLALDSLYASLRRKPTTS